MKIVYNEVKKLPVVYIDNFYDDDACEQIWQELCYFNCELDKFKSATYTNSAFEVVDGEKISLKDNSGLFLDDLYAQDDRNNSAILKSNRKVFSEQVMSNLVELHYFFNYIKCSTVDITLLNYYEESQYYLPHRDAATVTALSFFYQNPKSFSGGCLIIDNELRIECTYNRFVVFPSILLHEVTPVSMASEMRDKNFGRYSITQFIHNNK